MKKDYQKPAMCIVRIQHQSMVCSSVRSLSSGNTGITYGGAGTGSARVRSDSGFDWDDDWDE